MPCKTLLHVSNFDETKACTNFSVVFLSRYLRIRPMNLFCFRYTYSLKKHCVYYNSLDPYTCKLFVNNVGTFVCIYFIYLFILGVFRCFGILSTSNFVSRMCL